MPQPEAADGPAQHRGTVFTVQALRGIAALLVVGQHLATMCIEIGRPGFPFRFNGSTGLDIFFVLSGFIMPLSIRRSGHGPHDAGNFLRRRVERIVPLYWIATTVKLLKDRLWPGTVALAVWHTAASYLFLPSRNSLGEVAPLLPPGWTLNMEMVFYLLIALALLLGFRLRYLLPPFLMLLALGVFLRVPRAVPVDPSRLPLFLEFLLGMALAARFRAVRNGAAALPPWAAALCFAASLFLLVFSPWAMLAPLILAGPLAFAVVGCAVELEGCIGRRIPRFLLLLGDASYSIYLAHWFFVGLTRELVTRSPFNATTSFAVPLVLTFGMSIAAGLASYHWIEGPINRYFHVRRRTATAV